MMLNIKRLNQIKDQMNGQTLVAVTKYVGDEEINALLDAGVQDLGENRVQVFLNKYKAFKDRGIHWHFIGHLQSKKAKKMIEYIDFLHSLESLSLADEIQKRRRKPLACFLEVNISGENQKYGLNEENVIDFFLKIKDYDKINVIGLMGMATHTDDEGLIRHQFEILNRLKKRFKIEFSKDMVLSMGMSNDYQIALSMGSDYLRIGSLLFEEEN
jgi:hypothetical protein